MGRIRSKKVEVDGHTFDSFTEYEFYEYLKGLEIVKDIKLQPQFTLLEPFRVVCTNCSGHGKEMSIKTGKPINCGKCKGKGKKQRRGWSYTADFQVTYTNDRQEVIDVKGFANERFPLTKKMFENRYGVELVVIQKKKGEWVRK